MKNHHNSDLFAKRVYKINNGLAIADEHVSSNAKTLTDKNATGALIGDLMQMPLSFWVLDKSCSTVAINSEGVKICGFESEKDAAGKSLIHVSTKDSASKLITNCRDVLKSHQTKMFDELNIRKDNTSYQFLSIKVPLYNLSNEIMGICGFSIVIGHHSLASNLNAIKNLGLITPAADDHQHSLKQMSLSKRQYQCLLFLKKGYTAKMIGRELKLSHRTIESYIEHLKQKFCVDSKSELIQKIIEYRI